MLEIVGYVVVGLVVVVAAIFAIAATRPDDFRFARTARIAASPARLFALINDLKQMNTWNPYALRETAGTGSYSGPASGVGARHDFAGAKSGSGHIEILEATPNARVLMRLFMFKPFQADNRVELTLVLEGSATAVTWAMSGKQPILAKVMTLFIDCEKMVGKDFEEGLANLKVKAEQG